MASLGFHIIVRLRDDRPLAVDDDERRTLARAVLEIGETYGLFAFAAVDTHLHLASRVSATAPDGSARR